MLSTAYPVFASKHARIPPQFSTLLQRRHMRGRILERVQETWAMAGRGTRFAIERAKVGNSRPKVVRACALLDPYGVIPAYRPPKTGTPGAQDPAIPSPHPAGSDRRPSCAAARHGHRAALAAEDSFRAATHSLRRGTQAPPCHRRPWWHAHRRGGGWPCPGWALAGHARWRSRRPAARRTRRRGPSAGSPPRQRSATEYALHHGGRMSPPPACLSQRRNQSATETWWSAAAGPGQEALPFPV